VLRVEELELVVLHMFDEVHGSFEPLAAIHRLVLVEKAVCANAEIVWAAATKRFLLPLQPLLTQQQRLLTQQQKQPNLLDLRRIVTLMQTAPLVFTRLGAALKEEAGIEDGRLPGVYEDAAGGHAGHPWRSGIRRGGFEHVKGARHVSHADAAWRILELYQAHPAYVEAGRFTLGVGKYVNAAQLARLVAAARADAGR
jgi:hypothetical protein